MRACEYAFLSIAFSQSISLSFCVFVCERVCACVWCEFSISTKSFSRLTQQFICVVSQWRRQLNLSTRRTLFNGLSLWKRNCRSVSSVICKLDWRNWRNGHINLNSYHSKFTNSPTTTPPSNHDLWSLSHVMRFTKKGNVQLSALFVFEVYFSIGSFFLLFCILIKPIFVDFLSGTIYPLVLIINISALLIINFDERNALSVYK